MNLTNHSTLGNDIKSLFELYNKADKTKYPEEQVKRYPNISTKQFNLEHSNSLRIFTDDNPNGFPILTEINPQNFFAYNEDHQFFSWQDIFRIGEFFQLDAPMIIFLILKLEYEKYIHKLTLEGENSFSNQLAESANTKSAELKEILTSGQFLNKLIEQLSNHGFIGTAEYFKEIVSNICLEIFESRVIHFSVKSEEYKKYSDSFSKHFQEVDEGTESEKSEFWINRLKWIEKQNILVEIHQKIEDQEIVNRKIESTWYAIFGDEESEILSLVLKRDLLATQIELKEKNPEWSLEDVIEKSNEMQESSRLEYEDSISEIKNSINYKPEKDIQNYPGLQSRVSKSDNKLKELIKEICFLTHPDKLEEDPVYQKLTAEQKDALKTLLNETLEYNSKLKNQTDMFIAPRSERDLSKILEKVKSILSNAGLATDIKYEIPEMPMKFKIVWLKDELSTLDRMILTSKAKLRNLQNFEDIRRKKVILNNESLWDEVKMKLKGKIEALLNEIKKLDSKLTELFEDEENEACDEVQVVK
ncbi:MAG: hypothetical protein SCALA702_28110 [Melioribacteraceae bacterium]|nr:MAG: hypothetical protein SCALA702_28110 [Melioribacteraceae bacterium]